MLQDGIFRDEGKYHIVKQTFLILTYKVHNNAANILDN